jgi:transcriptional regulator with XRE-family HTH domain
MKISGKQVASARELLGITQPELAAAAGVGLNTVVRFETGQAEPYAATLAKIQAELERRGIDFINGNGPGVRLNLARAAEAVKAKEG